MSVVIDALAVIGGIGTIAYCGYHVIRYAMASHRESVKKREWDSRERSPEKFSLSTWIPGREF